MDLMELIGCSTWTLWIEIVRLVSPNRRAPGMRRLRSKERMMTVVSAQTVLCVNLQTADLNRWMVSDLLLLRGGCEMQDCRRWME